MNLKITHETRCSTPRRSSALMLGALTLTLGACVVDGILPDEIDVADEGMTGNEGTGEGDAEDTGFSDTTDEAAEGDGDGDDATTTGTGDGDGDGDQDTGDGDGDGDPTEDLPCADFEPTPLYDGANSIEVLLGSNAFAGSCGGTEGPEAIFSYTATSEGLFSFALSDADFDAVVYLAGEMCVPLDEWACDAALVETLLTVGQTVHVIVDSQQADVGGTATLTITGP